MTVNDEYFHIRLKVSANGDTYYRFYSSLNTNFSALLHNIIDNTPNTYSYRMDVFLKT